MVALLIQQSAGGNGTEVVARKRARRSGASRMVWTHTSKKETCHETRVTACAPHARCGVPHGGGIRGQDTHPCGAGKMACSTGAMQDAVQVMCAPTLTSRVMVVRRVRCV